MKRRPLTTQQSLAASGLLGLLEFGLFVAALLWLANELSH